MTYFIEFRNHFQFKKEKNEENLDDWNSIIGHNEYL